jgi:hypothetical protein
MQFHRISNSQVGKSSITFANYRSPTLHCTTWIYWGIRPEHWDVAPVVHGGYAWGSFTWTKITQLKENDDQDMLRQELTTKRKTPLKQQNEWDPIINNLLSIINHQKVPFPSLIILFPFKNQDLVHPCPTFSPFHRGLATRRRFPGTSRTPPRAMTRAWCFQCHNRWSPLLWCGWFSSGSASINSDRQRRLTGLWNAGNPILDMQKNIKKQWLMVINGG